MKQKMGKHYFCRIPNNEIVDINGKNYELHELLEEIRIYYASRSKKQALIQLIIEKNKEIKKEVEK